MISSDIHLGTGRSFWIIPIWQHESEFVSLKSVEKNIVPLFRILISSDIHLGYGEKLSIRNNDSFNSFDELLTVGKEQNVDMCILG